MELPKISPRLTARMAGVFQLLEALTATYGQKFALGSLIVSGDAAATAAKIVGHESLFWVGFASSVLGVVFHVAWALLCYELLKVVSRRVALFAVFIILVGCAIQGLTCVLYGAPMLVLDSGSSLSALTSKEVQALAYVFVRLNGYAFNTYLVFFGLWCVLTGFLIVRSTFMPKVIGILLAISGLGWLIFLVPPIASHLFIPYIAAASALGEIPLELWLIIFAVNSQRWHEQALGKT